MDLDEFVGLDNQAMPMGVGRNGVQSVLHVEDDQLVIEKKYDSQDLLDDCAASRQQGGSWGEGRIVGSMPPHIFQQMLKDGTAFDQVEVTEWFKANPHFLRFEPFGK